MPEMTSKVAHRYAGRSLSPGDTFHAEPRDVRVLIGLGRAEMIGGSDDAPHRTRAVSAAPVKKRATTRKS